MNKSQYLFNKYINKIVLLETTPTLNFMIQCTFLSSTLPPILIASDIKALQK